MDSKKNSRSWTIVVVFLGLLLLIMVVLPVGGQRWLSDAWAALAQPASDEFTAAQDSTDVAYVGVVELEWAMPGELSELLPTPTPDPDPEAAPPPDLGEIGLGLALVQSGDVISGYVDLDYTLVFTRRHEAEGVWYGPRVEGTFDETDLVLTSKPLSMVIGGQRLMRQFRLVGTSVPGQDGRLSGQYRETVWGYGPQPLTVLGTFTLSEAVVAVPQRTVYLPLVMRQASTQ